MYFCWELLLGGSNAEKWGDHQKKKFFKNNSLKSIKFKEDYDIIFVPKITQNGGRGGSRTAAASKMEHFVIIVNGCKPLIIITKSSILDVAAVLDPPLGGLWKLYICSTNEFELLFV